MPNSSPESLPAARLARRLGSIGVILGLVPWLLIVPLGAYQMEFMLWTWLWPAGLGGAATGAGLLAARLGAPRRLAGAAIGLGLIALLAAFAGYAHMLANMTMPM